ncbi:hypothetical protein B0H11DRAFT_2058145 [Mycena galericulata]|nr:hypothetical protein B0H11DRAFT_2058145 [Mycena galericulata]
MLQTSNLQVTCTVSCNFSRCLPQELQARLADQCIHEGLCNSNYASSAISAVTSLRPWKLDFGVTTVQPKQQSQSANHVHTDRLHTPPAAPMSSQLAPRTDFNMRILPVFLPCATLTQLMLHAVVNNEHDGFDEFLRFLFLIIIADSPLNRMTAPRAWPCSRT